VNTKVNDEKPNAALATSGATSPGGKNLFNPYKIPITQTATMGSAIAALTLVDTLLVAADVTAAAAAVDVELTGVTTFPSADIV
jgi:hypothetical protein